MTHLSSDSFLEKIMNIKEQQMGGASAGIIGSSTAEDLIIYNLRMSETAFAREYTKPKSDMEVLSKLSKETEGGLRTLQLTNAISGEKTEKLISDLHILAKKSLD